MEKFGIDFSRYSEKELRQIKELADEEIDMRRDERFTKRVQEFCAFAEELRKEFPAVDYPVDCYCSECDQSETFNLFDLINKFNPLYFSF